jgi:hypothetical protein
MHGPAKKAARGTAGRGTQKLGDEAPPTAPRFRPPTPAQLDELMVGPIGPARVGAGSPACVALAEKIERHSDCSWDAAMDEAERRMGLA